MTPVLAPLSAARIDTAAALPAPLAPPDLDVRDMPAMLLNVGRLLNSRTVRRACRSVAGRAALGTAVVLWAASFHEVPAGSLPDDEEELADFAGCRDEDEWRLLKQHGALGGFVPCADGRLYHPVVVDAARTAFDAAQANRARTEAARAARAANRLHPKEAPPPRAFEANAQSAPDRSGIPRGMPMPPVSRAASAPASSPVSAPAPSVTETVTDSKEGKKERKEERMYTPPSVPCGYTPALARARGTCDTGTGGASMPETAPSRAQTAAGDDTMQDSAAKGSPAATGEGAAGGTGEGAAPRGRTRLCPDGKWRYPGVPQVADGAEAWAGYAARLFPDRPAARRGEVGGYVLHTVAELVAEAAGLRQDEATDWRPLVDWLDAGLDPHDDVLPVIAAARKQPGYSKPRFLTYFEDRMRARRRRAPARAGAA